MKNKKRIVKIFSIFIMLMAIITITGCTSDKSKVKLLNQKEILKHAKKYYGKAIVKEENRTDDSVTYTLEDKEYGFAYTCTSYKDEICIAASCSGYYVSSLTCNFEENYGKYIIQNLNLNNIVKIYSSPNLDKIFLSLHYPDEDSAKNDIKKIIDQIKSIDKRKFFIDYNIKIYNTNQQEIGKEIGLFNIKTGKYTNVYDRDIEQMTFEFAGVVNGTANDKSGIKFLYYKKVQYKDVEGLKMEWLNDKSIKEDDWTVEYYFDYRGKTYFIIPDIVFIVDEDGVDRNYYSEKYTNYWFNK